ncbi:MAG: sugar ABC transporter ATP-binding protein [Caldilineaceae bacterium]|nr:sugar ABC transporter ATP-binding protein [Caldilineaceae bacterium]
MTTTPLLSIHHATKRYAGVHALRDAALVLERGEVHALMGENGAGKSTLIKILAGVVAPDVAEIYLNGQPIQIGNAAAAFAHGLRFIHQELTVVPQLSVAENLFLGRPYPKRLGLLVDWHALNRAATATLARLGIDHINPRRKIARLSPGDQMLVKIAATLLGAGENGQAAQLYVMDEPTAALTGVESERLFRVIAELKAQGRTVLYVSHRIDEVLRICDRVTVLRDGATVASKTIAETNQREIIQMMTGRTMAQVYPPATGAVGNEVRLDVRKLTSGKLRDIAFQVHAGEIVGVAGLAGAGTTDLLRALMGADPQAIRDVRLDGVDQGKLDPAQAWANMLAYVPQERRSQGLVLTRAIRDNVTMPHLSGLSVGGLLLNRPKEAALTTTVGKQVQLKANNIRQPAYQLSGGNQQKVVFARALANRPKVLLLDEPTRGVDVGAKYEIYTLIRAMSAEGVAVLMASSDLSELLGMCDRILVMVEHQIVATVGAEGLTQERLLGLCYGQRE